MSKPITAALLKRCQNENLQCLAGLRKTDPEAAEAIAAAEPHAYREIFEGQCWCQSEIGAQERLVYRLRPDTPAVEPYEDRQVEPEWSDRILRVKAPAYGNVWVAAVASHKDCLGFLYGTPEAPVLRTVLDLQYGQPYAVRFRAGS